MDADAGSVVDLGTRKGLVRRTEGRGPGVDEAHDHWGICDPESDGQTRPCPWLHGGYLTNDIISTNGGEVASSTHHYKVFSC